MIIIPFIVIALCLYMMHSLYLRIEEHKELIGTIDPNNPTPAISMIAVFVLIIWYAVFIIANYN